DVSDRDKILRAVYDRVIATETAGVMYWNITASHNPAEAVYTGPIERTRLEGAIYQDDPIPHDQVFRFDIYCPEDVTTCALIREASAQITSRVENPDPPFAGACFEPRIECGNQCILLDTSPDHCGACDNRCGQGETCRSGTCEKRGTTAWSEAKSPYKTEGLCSAAPHVGSGGTPSRHNSPWLLLVGLLFAGALFRSSTRHLS